MQKLFLLPLLCNSLLIISMNDAQNNIAAWLLVANKASNAFEKKSYTLSTYQNSLLLFPTTLPVYPIKRVVGDQKRPDDDVVLSHFQVWTQHINQNFKITISDDIEQVDDIYNFLIQQDSSIKAKFDGINNNRTAICCLGDHSTFYLYKLCHGLPNQDLVSNEAWGQTNYESEPQLIINGTPFPDAISLHPDQDIVSYGYSDVFGRPHIRILDIGEGQRVDISQPAPAFFKKILPSGNTADGKKRGLGEIHLGLTKFGTLIFFWLNEKNTLEYAEQKHTTIFSDIAVDNTKKHGDLKYKFAFLDIKGNVFFTNLLQQGNPRLVYSHTMEESPPDGFYYENGICSLITSDKFYTFPDNSNPYYISHELKNMDFSTIALCDNTENL